MNINGLLDRWRKTESRDVLLDKWKEINMDREVKQDILKKTREKISNESRWTKGDGAKDEYGMRTSATSPRAISWCVLGALEHAVVTSEQNIDTYFELESWLGDYVSTKTEGKVKFISEYNDSCTHDGMIALLDSAIVEVGGK